MKAKTLHKIYGNFSFEQALEDLKHSVTYGAGRYEKGECPKDLYIYIEGLKDKKPLYEEWANKCYEMSIKLEQFELFREERKGRYCDDIFNDGEVILK